MVAAGWLTPRVWKTVNGCGSAAYGGHHFITFARIENWTFAAGRLHGNVYGHPRFPEGAIVYSSTVNTLDKAVGVAQTHNTVYILGKPWGEPEPSDKRTRVQKLADALAMLEGALAYCYVSSYNSDVAGQGLTWSQWYCNVRDAVALLRGAIKQTRQSIASEVSTLF